MVTIRLPCYEPSVKANASIEVKNIAPTVLALMKNTEKETLFKNYFRQRKSFFILVLT